MFRQGLRELRAIFFPESNVAQATEYGIFGTQTPGEVAQGRQANPQAGRLEQEPVASAAASQRSPSDIAADARNTLGPEPGNGMHQGQDAGQSFGHGSAARSPSEIAANRPSFVPEQEHGHEPALGHDQSHGL